MTVGLVLELVALKEAAKLQWSVVRNWLHNISQGEIDATVPALTAQVRRLQDRRRRLVKNRSHTELEALLRERFVPPSGESSPIQVQGERVVCTSHTTVTASNPSGVDKLQSESREEETAVLLRRTEETVEALEKQKKKF